MCVCLWPKRLLSQAANSQISVSTRPTHARTRPDPQLTALIHAVLCCAVLRRSWPRLTQAAQCPFLPLGSSVIKSLREKMNRADKQMQQTFVCIAFMCMYAHW